MPRVRNNRIFRRIDGVPFRVGAVLDFTDEQVERFKGKILDGNFSVLPGAASIREEKQSEGTVPFDSSKLQYMKKAELFVLAESLGLSASGQTKVELVAMLANHFHVE